MNNLSKLTPQSLWENFAKICSIPHPSKHEDEIVAYLLEWAKKHNIKAVKDEVGNLILSKPATKGMENRKGVILQGHIDMVPQKNSDKEHDFTKDPIEPIIGDDGWVRANGTTLGADNGIGCAAAMSVLQATDIEHGPIEVLITIDEETGMTGAFGLKPGYLEGDILINLDSEDEGELYVGCAGGLDASVELGYKEEKTPADTKAFKISITGLKGGHSGMDIDTGRANANKVMIRLLRKSIKDFGLRLSSIEGGSLRNAIPREAFATVVVPNQYVEKFNTFVKDFFTVMKNEFSNVEPDIAVEITPIDLPSTVIDEKSGLNLVNVVYGLPNGVMRMSDSMENLVETSVNLAIVKTEKGVAEIKSLIRSSVDTAKEAVGEKMTAIIELAGGKITLSGGDPGWKPNMKSPILKTMQETYQKMYGRIPEIKAIHAGLECGLLGAVYPNWDMISFGPTIRNPHSPDERVHIESVEKFWDYLVETLKNIPVK